MRDLKALWEIEKIRKSGIIAAEILMELRDKVSPGMNTWELDQLAEARCREKNALPAFKNYRGYPHSLCVSVNEEVVHGMPSKNRKLKEGDIVSLDFGVLFDGYFGDLAVTVPVGNISKEAALLLGTTEESLYLGLKEARENHRLSDISHAIQRHVESRNFSVVRSFVGHGIGKALHEEPQVPNFGPPGQGIRLKKGMVLAIEPMVNAGGYEVDILEDGWTAVTRDRSLSAHFEHTIAISDNGCEILTQI